MTTVFPEAEFQQRCAHAQAAMARAGVAALLLTGEADVRYFSGFLTRFWESPTRPWFLVIPAMGKPVAVIPGIGAELMGATWVEDIRTWAAPDYKDDGVSLLGETLRQVTGPGARIGVPMGRETQLRMPLGDWSRLCAALAGREMVDATGIIQAQQQVILAHGIAFLNQDLGDDAAIQMLHHLPVAVDFDAPGGHHRPGNRGHYRPGAKAPDQDHDTNEADKQRCASGPFFFDAHCTPPAVFAC